MMDANLNSTVSCSLRGKYYDYLEDQLVLNNDQTWVTFARYVFQDKLKAIYYQLTLIN